MNVNGLSDKQFGAREVYELLGIDRNRLFHWIVTHGLLTPEFDEGRGRGKSRKFSRNNLLELGIIDELVRWRIDLMLIKEIKTDWEKNEVIIKEKDGKSKKYNVYDWAFTGTHEIGLRIFRKVEKSDVYYVAEYLHWQDKSLTRKEDREWLGPHSFIVLNVSTIARDLLEKIQKE